MMTTGAAAVRDICARDLMNPDVLTVRQDMPVSELAAFLVDEGISGAPVVDDEGKLVGVVSLVDVAAAGSGGGTITKERHRPDFYLRDLEEAYSEDDLRRLHIEEGEDLEVADIMTEAVFTVDEEATVSEVASIMLDAHLHRVMVTGAEDEIVGIISTSDLLGLLVDES